jgi:rhamnosyltransferase subunit B
LHRVTHFILTPVGSSGDAHPYIGLGERLRSRGHGVTLIAAGPHRTAAERAGLDFVSIVRDEDYDAASQDPDLWDARKGFGVVARMVLRGLDDGWRAIQERYVPGETLLVGHPLGFATRSFEDKHNAPSATLHLAPSSIRTAYAVPALPGGIDISSWPLLLKRALWALIDKTQIDPIIVPGLNAWRATHGLPPVERVFREWLNSPRRVIGLFPEWFGPRQPDWPAPFEFASFPLWDDPGRAGIDAELEQFLSVGSAPIVATPGTANRHAAGFFRAVTGAAERSGRRAILLTGFLEQVPSDLPSTVLAREYLPLSAILPRAAVLIHHGGVGTMAQAFASGTPQLVMPMAFDQPDNALRAKRAGVGRWINSSRFTVERVLEALDELSTPAVAATAASIRDRLGAVDGIGAACDLLEQEAG